MKKKFISLLLVGIMIISAVSPGFSVKPMDSQNMVAKPLVIMMEFPDYNHTELLDKYSKTPQQYENFDKNHYEQLYFNKDFYIGPDGEKYGTFRNYFTQISKGKYDVNGDIFGWLMADKPYINYGSDLNGNNSDQDEALELVKEAVQKVSKVEGIDLSKYDILDLNDLDNDGNKFEPDGIIDYVIVIHAGPGEEWSFQEEDIWPFRCGFTWYGDETAFQEVTDQKGNTLKADDFLIVEQDAPMGLVCHEYGHALGVADVYGSNDTIEMYSLYSGGSYAGGELVGCRPTGVGAVGREQLQQIYGGSWAEVKTLGLQDIKRGDKIIDLHEASQLEPNGTDLVRVNLPDYDLKIVTAPSGENVYFSGKGDNLLNTMDTEIDLSDAKEAVLKFKTWYDIDPEWDYASIQIKELDGEFKSIEGNITTNTNPNDDTPDNPLDRNPGFGITGSTNGEWKDAEFDLTKYIGKKVTLRFQFWTDGNTPMEGIYFDDIKVLKDGKIILNKGAEDKLDFEFKGFNITNGLESFNHYYLLEWRSHNGVDKGLENYSNYYKYNKQASAEAGLTIWYIDGRWGSAKDPNQSTGIPGEAYASIIDASQEPVYYTRRANSSKYDNFEKHVDRADVNLHDTPFGLHLEDSFFIDWGTVDTYDEVRDMNPVFNDSWDYSSKHLNMIGTNVPEYGLKIMVLGENQDKSQAKILLGIDKKVKKEKDKNLISAELVDDVFSMKYKSEIPKAYVGFIRRDENGNRLEEYVVETDLKDGIYSGKVNKYRNIEKGLWEISFISFEKEDGSLEAVYNSEVNGYGVNLSKGNIEYK